MTDAIATVASQFGVSIYTYHPEDFRLKVKPGAITARNEGGPLVWLVTADYSTVSSAGTNLAIDDPQWTFLDYGCSTEPIDQDAFGFPIANSARIVFPGVYDEVNNLTIRVQRWESLYNQTLVEAYTYPRPKLNNDTVTFDRINKTFLPGQLKIRNIRLLTPIQKGTADPVHVEYEMEYRGYYATTGTLRGTFAPLATNKISGFCKRIADVGRSGYRDDGGTRRHGKIVLVTSQGQVLETSEDVPLDGKGEPFLTDSHYVDFQGFTPNPDDMVNHGAIVEAGDSGVWLYYYTNNFIPFAPLGIF